jgi:hypothetical protein
MHVDSSTSSTLHADSRTSCLYVACKKMILISTNNIARGMVRDRHKYAFNSPKYAFSLITQNIFFSFPILRKKTGSLPCAFSSDPSPFVLFSHRDYLSVLSSRRHATSAGKSPQGCASSCYQSMRREMGSR